ncbi:MAG: hypothetical protein MJZ18_09195 [Bacteroidales bacterium]|nr:hypothetical protein [Bacteroidales bacterium]
MAKIEIKHKCIMIAREAARRDSNTRSSARSVFIKRYYGSYRLIGVEVSKKQRCCRDIFADAQKLASYELRQWNKKRHWTREAKRHKIKGAHRMAVSYFYKLLKENGGELTEELKKRREERGKLERRGNNVDKMVMIEYERWKQMNDESPFYYRKFGDIEEYYGSVMRMAG